MKPMKKLLALALSALMIIPMLSYYSFANVHEIVEITDLVNEETTASTEDVTAESSIVEPATNAVVNQSATLYSGTCGTNLTWYLDTATGVLTIDGTGDMYDYSSKYYNGSYRTTAPWKTYISYIKSVVISDSVTSIGKWAFCGCTSLKSVTISDSVTSIGSSAFRACYSLTSVTIPDSVTSIGNSAFYYCESLTSVTIPDSVTSIDEYAFYMCTSLTSVYITDIAAWCGIDFGSSDANPLYYADNLYLNNELITDLVIPDSVTSIGSYAFAGCTSLTSVTIPDSVTSIGSYAFAYCKSLTSMNIGKSVTSIGNYAFAYCNSLVNISICDAVTSIGAWAFSDCSSLTSVYLPDSVISLGDSAFLGCTSLVVVNVPENITELGRGMFANCTSLTSIAIPESVTTLGDRLFHNCTSLENIDIPAYVTSIGKHAFYKTAYYKNENNWENDTLYIDKYLICVDEAVSGHFTVKEGTVYICDSAFEDCTMLNGVSIPDSVVSIGMDAFKNCKALTFVEIPDSVTEIGYYAFFNCTALMNVNIPNSITKIRDSVFENCSSLTDIIIPDSVVSIGLGAFAGCTSITNIIIPDSVTKLGGRAFSGCTNLEVITIPESVTLMWYQPLYNCPAIIRCHENSSAHSYAVEYNIQYELIQSEEIEHNCFENIVRNTNFSPPFPMCNICRKIYKNLTLYSYNEEYYYIYGDLVVKNNIACVENAGDTGLECGWYNFDSDGKMVKDGFVELKYGTSSAHYYYYENARRVKGFKKIGDDYYFFNIYSGLMYKNTAVWINGGEYGIPSGDYYFGDDGKMVVPNREGDKQIVEKDGKLYFMIDGKAQDYGLYELDGDYYYVAYGVVLTDSIAWVSNNNLIDSGWYKFESDGKMMATGFLNTGTYTYYFEDYKKVKGIIKLDDGIYFFNKGSGMMYKDATLWVGENDLGIAHGVYYFDEDGRMVVPEPINGIVEENGNMFYYIDGVKQNSGLYEYDGAYYYALGDGYLTRGQKAWVSNTNGLVEKSFYYEFGADGKMISTGFVDSGENTYYLNDYVWAKGLTKIGDDFYFFNKSSGMMYENTSIWVGADNAYGVPYGTYYFDAEGKMVK